MARASNFALFKAAVNYMYSLSCCFSATELRQFIKNESRISGKELTPSWKDVVTTKYLPKAIKLGYIEKVENRYRAVKAIESTTFK